MLEKRAEKEVWVSKGVQLNIPYRQPLTPADYKAEVPTS